MSQECKCDICKVGCSKRAGWFLPDEIKFAAEWLNMTEKEFFDQYLGVDWYESSDDIFVLAPAISGMSPGSEYPGDPRGKCIFFNDDESCNIHPVKPYECKESYHTNTRSIIAKRHKFVAERWKAYQDYIVELLGDEPMAEDFPSFSLFY